MSLSKLLWPGRSGVRRILSFSIQSEKYSSCLDGVEGITMPGGCFGVFGSFLWLLGRGLRLG